MSFISELKVLFKSHRIPPDEAVALLRDEATKGGWEINAFGRAVHLLALQGKHEEAIALCHEYELSQPPEYSKHPVVMVKLAENLLALDRCEEGFERLQEAIQQFETWKRPDPVWDLRVYQANMLMWKCRYEDALGNVAKLSGRQYRRGRRARQLAIIRMHSLLCLHRFDEALEYAEQIEGKWKRDAEVHFQSGLCYLYSGRIEQASERNEKCLALRPNHENAAVIKERIEELRQRSS
jgi:tetratricopeptide (TPR) repeat protein